MTTSSDFHLFPELPAELRLMVWEHTRIPRLLHLKYMQTRAVLTLHPKLNIPFIPVAFHVCRESRDVAQRRYKLLVLSTSSKFQSRVYVDFGLDLIYFNNRFNRFGGYE